MQNVYLLLGSNENNRFENLEKARGLIALRCGEVKAQSALYETEAWGLKEQTPFINQAILIETALGAEELLVHLKAIEKEVGRIETVRWGPRVIDIDILFYGSEIIQKENLFIPHPHLQQRRFTLAPLCEIAARLVHPVSKKTIAELLEECEDEGEVKRVK